VFKALGPEKDKLVKGVISVDLLKTGDLIAGSGDGNVVTMKPGVWKATKKAKLDDAVTSLALRGDGQEVFMGELALFIFCL
jgi:hypothetical protein